MADGSGTWGTTLDNGGLFFSSHGKVGRAVLVTPQGVTGEPHTGNAWQDTDCGSAGTPSPHLYPQQRRVSIPSDPPAPLPSKPAE